MPAVAGVDGCHAGWFVVLRSATDGDLSYRVVYDFATVLDVAGATAIVAVDIPIGLLDKAVPGGRACDPEARRLLGPVRASSVFTPPVRPALKCPTYDLALKANRESSPHALGISQQCFGILPKIREVDVVMTQELQETVREIHPELCFHALNDGRAMQHPKKSAEGHAARLALLRECGFGPMAAAALAALPRGVEADDVLDACAACWTAGRIAVGKATRIPEAPARDSRGLRMEMWL